jgi:glycine cleavage system transcriptional repressor
MKQDLVMSVIFDTHHSPLQRIFHLISEHHGFMSTGKLLTIDDKQSLQLHIQAAWNDMAKLEISLTKLIKEFGCQLCLARTNHTPSFNKKSSLYSVELNVCEHTDTLQVICEFFLANQVEIYELSISPYFTNPLGYLMTTLRLYILIPEHLPIPILREDFVNVCDNLNIDAYLEPIHG